MSGIKDYSTSAGSNNAAPPNGAPEGMAPSYVNNTIRQIMADIRTWYEAAAFIDLGHTPTYASATTFTIATDVTSYYTANRRIKCTDATTLYGKIASSVYVAPNTTVTVTLDSGSLSASLTAVAVGLLNVTGLPVAAEAIAAGALALASLSTTGNATVGGTLGVTGATTLSSTLGVTGAATLSSTLGVTGLSTLAAATLSGLLTTNGQVKFPASQNASADVNTLDDYEEGTWTPSMTFGGASTGWTFTTGGTYTKVGRLVVATYDVTVSVKGSATGEALITGLPFASKNDASTDLAMGGAVVEWTSMLTTPCYIATRPYGTGTTSIRFRHATAGVATLTQLADTDFQATSQIRGVHVYFT